MTKRFSFNINQVYKETFMNTAIVRTDPVQTSSPVRIVNFSFSSHTAPEKSLIKLIGCA